MLFYRLAVYVYEYLLHVGAQNAAQTFLKEVKIQIQLLNLRTNFYFFFFQLNLFELQLSDSMGEKHNTW